jgi:subtilisin family serine protease
MPTPAGAAALSPANAGGPTITGGENIVEPSKQYLIAARGAVNRLRPPDFDMSAVGRNQDIASALESGGPGIRLIARLHGPQNPALAGVGPPAQDTIFVAELSDQQVGDFRRNFSEAIIAEDLPVDLLAPPANGGIIVADPGLLPIMPLEDAVELTLIIRGNGAPLEGANAYLMGSIFPAQGVSDANGRVDFKLYGERPDTIKALYVKPRADFWSLWMPRPSLVQGRSNVVDLLPLSAQYPGFPGRQAWGWGQVMMGLDRLDGSYRGEGVKVAVVDSGVQRDHPNLQVDAGRDLVSSNDAWGNDTVGHGTHCAGVICAQDTGSGIRGFAPDAELHAVRIFPGAQVSHLVEALNYCIEHGIDVVNMSLGIPQLGPPQIELLQGKLQQARASGVACVVAAGNTPGPVMYPAVFPEVLAVAALGQQGTFPTNSYHSTQIFEDAVPAAEELFSAKFTCFGPEIDVSAPGVAILSTFAPRGYAAMDGTSMAAPHVAGMAALLIAHHPELRGQPREADRVARLFEIIKQSSSRAMFPASYGQRVGAGLPGLNRAFAATPVGPTTTTGTTDQPQTGPSRSDLEAEFPMFHGMRPSPLGAASLQAELEDLAQLERTLAQPPASQPQTASTAGPGAGPGHRDPQLLQLDDAMRAYGLLQTASQSGAGSGTAGRDPRLGQLDVALAAAGLSFPTAPNGGSSGRQPQGTGASSAYTAPPPYDMPTPSEAELQFLDTFLRDQIEDLVQQLRRYVNQYSRVSECVPLVNQTVHQFGAREYVRALSTGYQALTCIRSKLGG